MILGRSTRTLRYSKMTSTPFFRHLPLKPGEDSFRLLRLPAAENAASPLQCEIFDARSPEWGDRYVAGSYVWGSELKTKAIKINNQNFMVGDNLYDFLYACRSHLEPQTSVVLWIDAICIDQLTGEERNHQVGIMANIYTQARCVCSWLGPADVYSDWLYLYMSRFQRMSALNDYEQFVEDIKRFWAQSHPFELVREDQRSSNEPHLHAIITALFQLGQRDYFARIWITQEFVLARDVVLLFGTRYLRLQTLEEHLPWILTPNERISSNWSMYSFQKSTFYSYRKLRTGPWAMSFEGLFETYGSLASALPHDKVYALMGLAARDDKVRQSLIVSYNSTKYELLDDLLRHGTFGQPLRFIRNALHQLDLHPSPGLSSSGVVVSFELPIDERFRPMKFSNSSNVLSDDAMEVCLAHWGFDAFLLAAKDGFQAGDKALHFLPLPLPGLIVRKPDDTTHGLPSPKGRILGFGVLGNYYRPKEPMEVLRLLMYELAETTEITFPNSGAEDSSRVRAQMNASVLVAMVYVLQYRDDRPTSTLQGYDARLDVIERWKDYLTEKRGITDRIRLVMGIIRQSSIVWR